MPTLSIKNVPEDLLAKLRERAARHHRSIQGELMSLLYAAVEAPANSAVPTAAGEQLVARASGTRRIEAIAAEHRNRWKTPFKKGPRAVDLIRAERNAR